MYESFYGLARRPFLPGPTPQMYFAAFAIESAYETLFRCLGRGEGAGLVVGPAGTGKTLLCLRLAEALKRQFQVAMPDCGRVSDPKTLLQAILFEIGRPYRGMDEGELRLSLVDHLSCDGRCPGGMLLIMDEAQSLPYRLLDELRLLTNLVRQGEPRVRLLLAGGPALEERLAHPKLEQFSQRIAARCYLEAFNREETEQYIAAQLTHCGGDVSSIFTEDALEAIYRATDGIPRMVNQVCDHALVLGFAGERMPIDAGGIEEAWADLQQLPTPWNAQSSPCGNGADASDVIEFGALDETDAPDEKTSTIEQHPGTDEVGSKTPNVPEATIEIGTMDDSESAIEDAGRQIDQIEKYVDELSHDFEPLEADSSEVQLACVESTAGDEAIFDEEELIIDRYLDLEELELVRHQTIGCAEGRELAAMLRLLENQPSQTLRLAEPDSHVAEKTLHRVGDEQPASQIDPHHRQNEDSPAQMAFGIAGVEQADESEESFLPTTPCQTEVATISEVAHGQEWEQLADAEEAEGLPQSENHIRRDRAISATGSEAADDGDVIVIEDSAGASTPMRSSRVRRREYRLLFRQLRSG